LANQNDPVAGKRKRKKRIWKAAHLMNRRGEVTFVLGWKTLRAVNILPLKLVGR
jgi:hypothetical protein